MIIETKFNIGDTVYYGDETSYEKGRVDNMSIIFMLNTHYVMYKVDKDYYTSFRGRPDKVRYQEFGESMLFSSPSNLIEQNIAWSERQIDAINNKIDELKSQLKSLDK
jgi:hypothetical protein